MILAADAGPIESTLFPAQNRFPDGSGPLRAVARDCGISAPLADGSALWLFCDTAVYDDVVGATADATGRLRLITSGSVAVAASGSALSPAQPIALDEAVYPAMPKAFMASSRTSGVDRTPIVCAQGRSSVAWTSSLVSLPGTDTVVSFFQDHCPDWASGFAEYDVGVGEFSAAAATSAATRSATGITLGARYDSVLVNPTPGSSDRWGHTQGAVADGEHIYVYMARRARYSCTVSGCKLLAPGAVTLARVRWADREYRVGANYEYFSGEVPDPWSGDPADATSVLDDTRWPSGDGLSVGWYPQLRRYVMAHADTALGAARGMAVRTAPTPWGPWSAPADVRPDPGPTAANRSAGCTGVTTCRTFLLHPHLSTDSDRLFFGYVRNNDLPTAGGEPVRINGTGVMQVRLGSIGLADLPWSPDGPVRPEWVAPVVLPPDPAPGTITDDRDGAGLSGGADGARVLIHRTDGTYTGKQARADEQGGYSLGGVAPGRYKLLGVAAGYRNRWAGGTDDPGSAAVITLDGGTGPALVLARNVSGSATVSGRITDATSDLPVAGATVRLWQTWTESFVSTTCDADGRYEFALLPAGTFQVQVTKSGSHVTRWFGGSIGRSGATSLTTAPDMRLVADATLARR